MSTIALLSLSLVLIGVGYLLGLYFPPYLNRKSFSSITLDAEQALERIKNFRSKYPASPVYSGHIKLGELENLIFQFKKLIAQSGCNMTGIEIFLARNKANSFILLPTINSVHQEIPVFIHNNQLFKVYHDQDLVSALNQPVNGCTNTPQLTTFFYLGLPDDSNGAVDTGGTQMRPPYPN